MISLRALQCRNILGNVLNGLGQGEASIDCHPRVATIAREAGHHQLQALAESNTAAHWIAVGRRAAEAGQPDAARAAWGRAVETNDAAFRLAETCQASTARVTAAINRALALARQQRAALAGKRRSSSFGPMPTWPNAPNSPVRKRPSTR